MSYIKGKNSQAAMEILINYGWVFVVVLVVIASFLIFMPSNKLISDKADISPGLTVRDMAFVNGEITLFISNGLGRRLDHFQVKVTECNNEAVSAPINIIEGKTIMLVIECEGPEAGTRFKSSLIVNYSVKSGNDLVQHQKKGSLFITPIEFDEETPEEPELPEITGPCKYNVGEDIIVEGDKVFCDSVGGMWTPTVDTLGLPDGEGERAFHWDVTGHFVEENCTGLGYKYPACDICDELNYAGYDDWVLPSCDSEMLDEDCQMNRFWQEACSATTGCPAASSWDSHNAQSPDNSCYWASNTKPGQVFDALLLNVSAPAGTIASNNKASGNFFVRCVRQSS